LAPKAGCKEEVGSTAVEAAAHPLGVRWWHGSTSLAQALVFLLLRGSNNISAKAWQLLGQLDLLHSRKPLWFPKPFKDVSPTKSLCCYPTDSGWGMNILLTSACVTAPPTVRSSRDGGPDRWCPLWPGGYEDSGPDYSGSVLAMGTGRLVLPTEGGVTHHTTRFRRNKVVLSTP
jgi:hypothetical protein